MRGSHDGEDIAQSTADDTKQLRNPVVVIPGFMGSELWAGGDRVWPNVRRLVGRPEFYRYPHTLQVGGLMNDIVVIPNLFKLERYSRLVQFLEKNLGYKKGKDLMEFPYDWRQDNRLSARRLAEAVDQWEVDSHPDASGTITRRSSHGYLRLVLGPVKRMSWSTRTLEC
ncbi:MAG: hypothetical protein AABZ77_02870 [Chloroflexota bacterium]